VGERLKWAKRTKNKTMLIASILIIFLMQLQLQQKVRRA